MLGNVAGALTSVGKELPAVDTIVQYVNAIASMPTGRTSPLPSRHHTAPEYERSAIAPPLAAIDASSAVTSLFAAMLMEPPSLSPARATFPNAVTVPSIDTTSIVFEFSA